MTQPSTAPDFWAARRAVNAGAAIFHQWEQLVAAGCIENFRIAGGETQGLRVGWFFADSDAYKWLDAAARIWAGSRDQRLGALIDGLIALLGRAQQPDGYLFTYNQIHFPGERWQNLQIEHELYCHGHLIEAGIAHSQATGQATLLDIARRAADRVVADFRGKGPAWTPGHPEIELALLKLHEVLPGDGAYLELARQFIEQRGRTPRYAVSLLRQNRSVARRRARVQAARQEYLAAHPEYRPYVLPPDNISPLQRGTRLRWAASALSGKYLFQNAPLRAQAAPLGHAVRFGYYVTAGAMLARLGGDPGLLPALERLWERMVARRMYVTGGLGAVPGIEGFGRDDELDPRYAYAETCAALSSMFWSWEMSRLTGAAKYSELLEWQLYNAAGVGMGLDGTTYLYNNPLECHGEVVRQPWYSVPCCPSNLSRIWAGLEQYILSATPGEPGALRVHQYISTDGAESGVRMQSALPWQGRARLTIEQAGEMELHLRQPVWAAAMRVSVNGAPAGEYGPLPPADVPASGGYDPRASVFRSLRREWAAGEVVDVEFDIPVLLLRAGPRVRGHAGKVALARGPLVYCLESSDHPGVNIFTARLDPTTLRPAFDPDLLGGVVKIEAMTTDASPLTFIPYFLWDNRGPAQMTVWVRAGNE